MEEIKTIAVNCPKCNEDIHIKYPVEVSNFNTSCPNVRSNLKPDGNILVYRISSEQIKDFIIQKARYYVPDVHMTIVPRYCEKKRKNENDPHRSYASFRIAFSEHVIEQKTDLGWYGEIGNTDSNVKLQQGIMNGLIKKYQYNRKQIDAWLKDYKLLEDLEENFGITEAYLNDLRMYAIPQRIKADDNASWIIFAAAAENVIIDMLTEVGTNVTPGCVRIHDVYPMTKDIIEFVIHIHPNEMKDHENPHVRQILLGEEKPKK